MTGKTQILKQSNSKCYIKNLYENKNISYRMPRIYYLKGIFEICYPIDNFL